MQGEKLRMNNNHSDEHIDEDMIMIQANVDDMNPEFSTYVSDMLFELGANDVFWIPMIMKKGRPGLMLHVLTDKKLLFLLETVIFRETTTLGIRYSPTTVHRLGRIFKKINTAWGLMTVKVGYHQGEMVQYAPEFKECEQIAKRYGVPLKEVYDEVRKQFMMESTAEE